MDQQEIKALLENIPTPIYKIEIELGMPATILQKAIKGKRKLPKKWLIALKGKYQPNNLKYNILQQSEELIPLHNNLEELPTKIDIKANYDFGSEKYLVIEKYTKYPLKNKPISKFEQIKWLKEKEEADNEIKIAWREFKKTTNFN